MASTGHHTLSASASKRWMNCPRSIALIAQVPEKVTSSRYADEGTAAHQLAENCFTLGMNPEDFIGQFVEVEGNQFEVTDEMAEYVTVYVDYCRQLEKLPGAQSWTEVKFELKEHSGELDLGGTADKVVLAGDTLYVCDLKYGRGVVVQAKNNSQMRIYACGAKRTLSPEEMKAVKNVKMVIIQPRAKDANGKTIRDDNMTTDELLTWEYKELYPAVKRVEAGSETLCSGEWCRFCPAIGICPEQRKTALEVCQADFKDMCDTPTLPKPEALTVEQMAKAIDLVDMLSAWARGVQAHAQALAEKGTVIPGYKLVQKRANRKWIDREAAAKYLVEKLKDDAYQPREIISPTLAEKRLKKDEGLAQLITRPDNGLVLAPESDPRQEVKGKANEFVEMLDFMQ